MAGRRANLAGYFSSTAVLCMPAFLHRPISTCPLLNNISSRPQGALRARTGATAPAAGGEHDADQHGRARAGAQCHTQQRTPGQPRRGARRGRRGQRVALCRRPQGPRREQPGGQPAAERPALPRAAIVVDADRQPWLGRLSQHLRDRSETRLFMSGRSRIEVSKSPDSARQQRGDPPPSAHLCRTPW